MNNNALAGLSAISQEVLAQHKVRKNKQQKAAFRDAVTHTLAQAGWHVQTEEVTRFPQTSNLIVGDPDSARLILTAHYDTPARLPFPNFLAPRNLVASLLYQILLVALILAVVLSLSSIVFWLTGSFIAYMFVYMFFFALVLVLMLAGPANPNNVNDNTSGVLTLLETALAMPQQLRGRVAFVFFDNEELGLVGSNAFRRKHGQLSDKLLLNFDCVGVGDTMLFVQNRACRKDALLKEQLQQAFATHSEKKVEIDNSAFTLYPSDQMWFPRGIGIVALKKAPLVGLYVNRIHTARDTLLQPENISMLRDGITRLASTFQ